MDSTVVHAILSFFLFISLAQTQAAIVPEGFIDEEIGAMWGGAAGMTFAADGRMFVWQNTGKVWIVKDGVREDHPFIDISEEVGAWRDHGMLGFSLHPDFLRNGYCYLYYVVDHHYLTKFGTPDYDPTKDEFLQAAMGRITRYTARAEDDFHSVDPSSRLILLGRQPGDGPSVLYITHGVGSLVFGADGSLLASCGDAAGTTFADVGSSSETYAAQGLADGIIRPEENVGAFRSQMLTSLNGKILRLDPETGDGLPSNPFYDPSASRSARSRVWALGLRNPFRMDRRPGTGSHHLEDGNPGTFLLSDVGLTTWEEIDLCDRPGMNFGWPLFEGYSTNLAYAISERQHPELPNPLAGSPGCSLTNFRFQDLLREDSLAAPTWPNPCNPSQPIPATVPRFVHSRPLLDYRHDALFARTASYDGSNAVAYPIGDPHSTVVGQQFYGQCVIGGTWSTNTTFPEPYRDCYFFADFVQNWIQCVTLDPSNRVAAIHPFIQGASNVVCIISDTLKGDLYYMSWNGSMHRVRYAPTGNHPPVAVASADRYYGPSPLAVQFSSAGSQDQEGSPLTFRWVFGDGSPDSTNANPAHTFNFVAGVPTRCDVSLIVTDAAGASSTNRIVISVNNTPPQVHIVSPVDGTRYSLSQQTIYDCMATVVDAEHGWNDLRCQWQTVLHHNTHTHPEPFDTNCTTTTVISPIGCNGETYYFRVTLVVTDAAGLAGTNEVYLLPECAPEPVRIITPPQGLSATLGEAVELSVRASGDPPLFYSWLKDGQALVSQNGPTLAFPSVQWSDRGSYSVVVSNRLGALTSSPPAMLTLPNTAPSMVHILEPTNETSLFAPAFITIHAEAADAEGPVARIVFLLDGQPLGESLSFPFDYQWSNVPPGIYLLSARAIDEAGLATTSDAIRIEVKPPLGRVDLIGSTNRWRFWDQGTPLSADWMTLGFDDSGWGIGSAPLGYGFGDEATILSYGSEATNKFVTTYFRCVFRLPEGAVYSDLQFRLMRDDGVLAFLNGQELVRQNLPNGPVVYATWATKELKEPVQSAWIEGALPADPLHSGDNVLAAEIHQANPASPDLRFAFELSAVATPAPSLRATLVDQTICLEWADSSGSMLRLYRTTELSRSDSWSPVQAIPTLSGGKWRLCLDRSLDTAEFFSLR